MSETDSFIEEVTEEVRRDRLFAMFKRYGWIAAAAVVLIVGGASYNEVRKAKQTAAEQALGDSLIAALENDDPIERQKALAGINPDNAGTAAVVALLRSKEQYASGDVDDAIATLEAVSDSTDTPLAYRQVATFKVLGLKANTLSADERRAGYQTLIGQNPQLRLMAEEQLALIDIDEGKTEAALSALQAIVTDEEATAGLRRRATQLIVALGGDLDALSGEAEDAADEGASQ